MKAWVGERELGARFPAETVARCGFLQQRPARINEYAERIWEGVSVHHNLRPDPSPAQADQALRC